MGSQISGNSDAAPPEHFRKQGKLNLASGLIIAGLITGTTFSEDLYVSPLGSDSQTGSQASPFKTLGKAVAAIAQKRGAGTNENINVFLRSGIHRIESTLVISEKVSGSSGSKTVFQPYLGEFPVISGGVLVEKWSAGSNGVWSAPLKLNKKVRHIWVNGKRAVRARGNAMSGTAVVDAQGKAIGISLPGSVVPVVKNPHDVEIQRFANWQDHHLCVDSMYSSGASTVLIMQQPYFEIAQHPHWAGTYPKPNDRYTLENAREFVDAPGEFYFDQAKDSLFYLPRPGENLNQSEIIAPVAEVLIRIYGESPAQKVRNVEFKGLTFSHDSYQLMKVGNSYGYTTVQSVEVMGRALYGQRDPVEWRYGHMMTQAAVEIQFAEKIRMTRNKFEHLSGMGINALNSVVDCDFEGNIFRDLSSSAINVGHAEHDFMEKTLASDLYPFKQGQEEVCTRIRFRNNLIRECSMEFQQSPALSALYAAELDFSHNDIGPMSYTTISVGWGWHQVPTSTSAHDNKIVGNRINGSMQKLNDGGAIYTLGQMPRSIVSDNYIFAQGTGVVSRGQGIYPDQGSAFITFKRNVYNGKNNWLYIHNGNSHDLEFDSTFTNSERFRNDGKAVQIQNTILSSGEAYSAAAESIIEKSGLEPGFRDLLETPTGIQANRNPSSSPNRAKPVPIDSRPRNLLGRKETDPSVARTLKFWKW